MKKIFLLLALLLFSQVGWAWWNTSWGNRNPIIINGSISQLTDYQVLINLNWSSDMNSTFTDLRFTDNSTNGVLLPYWIENYTASNNVTVWVKTNLSVGNNTIYVYYGNPSVGSASNPNTTFIAYQDGTDTSKWAITNDATTFASETVNGRVALILNDTGTQVNKGMARLEINQTVPIIATFYALAHSGPAGSYSHLSFVNETGVTSCAGQFDADIAEISLVNAGSSVLRYWNGTTEKTGSAWSEDTWYAVNITLNYTNQNNIFFNRTQQGSNNMNSHVGASKIRWIELSVSCGGADQFWGAWDDLIVRQYASPAPVVLRVGAAEIILPVVSIQSPSNKTYNTAMIDLNFTAGSRVGNISSCVYELDGVNTTIAGCQNTSITNNNLIKQNSPNTILRPYSQSTGTQNTTDNNFGDTTTKIDWTAMNYPLLNFTFLSKLNSTPTITYQYQNLGDFGSVLYLKAWNYTSNAWQGTPCAIPIFSASDFFNINGGTKLQVAYGCPGCACPSGIINVNISDVYGTGTNNSNGAHSIKVWANDTANNWGVSSTVSFTVDTTPPSATIQLPVNATYNKLNGSVTLNFTTSDNFGVSQCKYELDGVNTSLPTCANTTLSLTDGSHRIKVWVNDTAGNWNSTPLIYFVSDFTEPNIQIQSPTNSTYTISTVALNFTISESIGLSTCKYELDGVNTTISCNANTTIIGLSHGGHNIKIWANDTAGNMNVSAITSFSNDIVLYVYVFDESTPTQNVTFNLTISNTTASRTINNNQYYIGNFSADPRGSLTLSISAAGYTPRTFYTTWDGTSKVNYTAYLLQGSNQYTFYIKNSNSIAISNAVVTIQRSINNVLQTVGQGTTDTAGTTVFTLTPNQIYSVQIIASNYNTYTGTILPTTASYSYTITMSSSTPILNYKRTWTGISYTYQPSWTLLKNDMNIFNFTIYSTVDALTQYGMNITVNGTNLFSQTGNTSTGGSIQATLDLSNYTTQAGYARLWFIKSGDALQYIQPDKNFNLYGTAKSNISVSSVLTNFGNSSGITEQTRFFIAVILSILSMAISAGFGFGRDGSAVIGLLIFGAFVWIGWVPAMYLVYGILFVFAISIIKRGVY